VSGTEKYPQLPGNRPKVGEKYAARKTVSAIFQP